jgi:tetratricopeptide (TPR) repeat protein
VRAPAVYEGLGAAYALNGDFHRAAVAFKTALSLAPGSSNAVRGLARILLELKQTDEVVELLVEYLEKMPHDNAARELLARGYEARKQRRSAIAQLTIVFAAIDTSDNDDVPSKARISNNIGASFLNDGDLKQAQRWLTRSVEYASMDNPIPYQNLTRCYLMTMELTKAVETARLTRARFPHDPSGAELLSISLRELGLYDDAIREARLFIDSGQPATAGIYADLGYMLTDAKRDYDSALVFLQQGYDKFKHDSLVATISLMRT